MSRKILISVSKEIFEIVPGYRRVVLVASDIQNGPSSDELKQLLREQEKKSTSSVTIEDERLVAWREAFHAAGIKPNKFRPSVDALTRRVLNGNELPSISALVDIGTVLSLRHVLPCGAHSLDDVDEELVLRKASGVETFTPFGAEQSEMIVPGEVIFVDGNKVATSKWAWRQAVHTIIRPETTAFELNIDALSVITDDALGDIVSDAQATIKHFLGVDTSVIRLTSDNPDQMISLD
jgi:DNA/RNA-binding domain of Phe-tRNA-synthetase-like protein